MNTIFNDDYLRKLEDRARRSRQEEGSPEIAASYYAARRTKGVWKISNGKTWWDNPVLVREFHEYADGSVTTRTYIEDVGMFSRRNIEKAGMKAIHPSELTSIMPIAKVVYIDHRNLNDKGRPIRVVREMEEKSNPAEVN